MRTKKQQRIKLLLFIQKKINKSEQYPCSSLKLVYWQLQETFMSKAVLNYDTNIGIPTKPQSKYTTVTDIK